MQWVSFAHLIRVGEQSLLIRYLKLCPIKNISRGQPTPTPAYPPTYPHPYLLLNLPLSQPTPLLNLPQSTPPTYPPPQPTPYPDLPLSSQSTPSYAL